MADFGEQLRKARQDKGMTQQSLAEKLYVTRQTVSRWEGGERYPDLLTVKKLVQVLDVDAGYLLSDDETHHIAERNPVVEKKTVNHVTLVLFSGIIVSCLISIISIFVRLPSIVGQFSVSDIWIFGGNLASELIGIAAFSVGFVCVLKDTFSQKNVGTVMMLFFVSTCIKAPAILTTDAVNANWIVALLPAIFGAIGIVAAYFYFRKNQLSKVWSRLLIAVSVLEIVRAFSTVVVTAVYSAQYISTGTVLSSVLNICIYVLLIYQVYALNRKRCLANEISQECKDEKTQA